MTNIDKLKSNSHIVKAAARNLGWRWDKDTEPIEPYLEQLKEMSGKEIFDRYCEWHGLIGWGDTLWDVVEELQKVEAER